MDIKEWLTTGTAATGAVLGIYNLWRQMSSDRVRLRVAPSLVVAIGNGRVVTSASATIPLDNIPHQVSLAVEVLNLSSFPVTIDEIGMTSNGPDRMIFVGAHTGNHEELPIRLESRESLKLYTRPYDITEFARAVEIFAETVCGHRRFGKSPSITSLKQVAAVATRLPKEFQQD